MSWTEAWTFRRSVVGPLRRGRGRVADLYEACRTSRSSLFVSIAVDDPEGGELALLHEIEPALGVLAWNGESTAVPVALQRLCDEIAHLAAARRHRAGSADRPDRISVGGIAWCRDQRLVAFRIGTFRVVLDGAVVRRENTAYQDWLETGREMPRGFAQKLRHPTRSLPTARLDEGDLVWLAAGAGTLAMYQSPVGRAQDHDPPEILIEAEWVDAE
jgi:hypothetical protein